MKEKTEEKKAGRRRGPSGPSIFAILKPYKGLILILLAITVAGNALQLVVPKLISRGIDTYAAGSFDMSALSIQFTAVAVAIFIFTYLQGIMQTYAAEKAARDMRNNLAAKIADFSFSRLVQETEAKLLTNLTSDIDAVKTFISQAVVILISSVVLIVGSAILLIMSNWKLALAVLAILPLIGLMFFLVFSRLGPLFKKSQEVIDRLNATISESIIGAALVRVFSSEKKELEKFGTENAAARDTGLKILKIFSVVIPTIGIIAQLAMLVILALGGKFVIAGDMSLGEFTAFNSYVGILIFPIIMMGVVSNIISRAQQSYVRIATVLNMPAEKETGTIDRVAKGDIEVRNLDISFGDKHALKDVSFSIKAGTRNAIIGPTAAGKTQLLYALIGLAQPSSGEVLYDGRPLTEYKKEAIHSQVALVFQDSVMFNLSLRENIAFSATASEADLKKAIETAELSDFVASLPQGLETSVSERGTSLSGGQKQRVMLARALSINPRVILLDDFTARVDQATEKKILANVEKNYPGITIVSVTQKVRSVEHFDNIVLLMEGEVLAQGTHAQLSASSPEYAQIIESQKSTHAYEN
ncbi:MAG TPA: ABC transporter ATP-binding protein [Candidatus Paceibacterota bacterium]